MHAVNRGTDEEFATKVDVDEFLRVSVTRAAMGAIDAFAADGNNFYLYDNRGSSNSSPGTSTPTSGTRTTSATRCR